MDIFSIRYRFGKSFTIFYQKHNFMITPKKKKESTDSRISEGNLGYNYCNT